MYIRSFKKRLCILIENRKKNHAKGIQQNFKTKSQINVRKFERLERFQDC